MVYWLSLRSNWTNPTSLSLQASPVSDEANPIVHHGVIRVTNQALPMHQANQEQRESADVGHVDAAQKQSSVLDCVRQLTRLLWQPLAALHQLHQHPCLPLCHPCLPWDLRQPD